LSLFIGVSIIIVIETENDTVGLIKDGDHGLVCNWNRVKGKEAIILRVISEFIRLILLNGFKGKTIEMVIFNSKPYNRSTQNCLRQFSPTTSSVIINELSPQQYPSNSIPFHSPFKSSQAHAVLSFIKQQFL
jgi:hypothetical protein